MLRHRQMYAYQPPMPLNSILREQSCAKNSLKSQCDGEALELLDAAHRSNLVTASCCVSATDESVSKPAIARKRTDLCVEIHLDGTVLDTRTDCDVSSSGSYDIFSVRVRRGLVRSQISVNYIDKPRQKCVNAYPE